MELTPVYSFEQSRGESFQKTEKKSYKCHWMFNITNILLYILQWKGPDLFYWFRNHELLQEIYFSHSQRTAVRITVPRKKPEK